MPEEYGAKKKTLGELLSLTSPPICVPEWQRDFSWETSQVDTFWRDLNRFADQYPGEAINEREYFIGSVVLVDTGLSHLLLDGQQRLATATILLSVVRDHIKPFREDAAARTQHKFIAEFDDTTGATSFKLTLNVFDRDFFRREIQEGTEGGGVEPDTYSHKLIRKAREYFTQRFDEAYVKLGGGQPAFQWALRMQKVLTSHVSVVAITSDDEVNASTVFETLNDRGIGLSTPDLLRNLLLRRAPDTDRDEIIDCWRDVLEVEGEASVEDFLRHYWLSIHGDVKTRGLYRTIKDEVEVSNTDSLKFSRDLQEAANLYSELLAGRDADLELARLLKGVKLLGAKSLMPAILSAYAVGNADQKRKFLRSLTSLYVRHNVIGNLENSRLETIVFEAAKTLRADQDFGAATAKLQELAPDDPQFVNQFKIAQIAWMPSARYVLREIEHQLGATQELSVETPDRVHVEHIYPQKPEAGGRWANHAAAVNRLGNLTLLAQRLNSSIKNKPFAEKRPKYLESQLLMTKQLAGYEHWTFAAIEERQERLAGLAPQIWTFTA